MSDNKIVYVVAYADISEIYNVDPPVDYTGGDTLLVLKDRPSWMKGRLNLLGGKVEPGEHPVDAAVRELKEESGLDGYMPQYMGHIEGTRSIIHCVKVVVNPLQPIQPREGETEKVAWYHWDVVEKDPRLMPNLRITVPFMRVHPCIKSGWLLEDRTPYREGERYHTVYLTLPRRNGEKFKYKIDLGRPDEKITFIEMKENTDGTETSREGQPDCKTD